MPTEVRRMQKLFYRIWPLTKYTQGLYCVFCPIVTTLAATVLTTNKLFKKKVNTQSNITEANGC